MPVRYDSSMNIAINYFPETGWRAARAALVLCAATSLLTSVDVNAARPMITDDARMVDAQSCQVESWFRKTPSGNESWALPACNPTGNFEFTLGGGTLHSKGAVQTRDLVIQAKTLLKPLNTNGWGIGLSLGNIVHSGSELKPKALGDIYVNVPMSMAFVDDTIVLHANAGWLRERAQHADRATWGLAAESRLNDRIYLVTEAFGRTRDKTQYQIGLRFWVIPDRVQVDTTYGDAFSGPGQSRWISIGVRLLSPPFLR